MDRGDLPFRLLIREFDFIRKAYLIVCRYQLRRPESRFLSLRYSFPALSDTSSTTFMVPGFKTSSELFVLGSSDHCRIRSSLARDSLHLPYIPRNAPFVAVSYHNSGGRPSVGSFCRSEVFPFCLDRDGAAGCPSRLCHNGAH